MNDIDELEARWEQENASMVGDELVDRPPERATMTDIHFKLIPELECRVTIQTGDVGCERKITFVKTFPGDLHTVKSILQNHVATALYTSWDQA